MYATCIADFTALPVLKRWHLTMKKIFLRTLCSLCCYECLWAMFVEHLFCTRYLLKSFLLRASIQGHFSTHILVSLSATFVTLIPSRTSLFLWLQDIALLWFSFSLFACSFSVLSPPLNVESSRVWLWPLALLTLLTFPKTVSEQQQQKTQVFFLTSTSHSPWLNDLWNFMFSTSLLDVKMIDPIDFLLSLPNF